jgi:hypothetical protein
VLEIDRRRLKTAQEMTGVDQITRPPQQVPDQSFNRIVDFLKRGLRFIIMRHVKILVVLSCVI